MPHTIGSSVTTITPLALHTPSFAPGVDASHVYAVDYILDELFFTVGQSIGSRKTLEYEAVVWWRDHYRAAFLQAMSRFGNRWTTDRQVVGAVAMLLAERAVRHTGDHPTITRDSAERAAADAQRYCTLHQARRARTATEQMAGRMDTEGVLPMIAGYWCVEDPPPPSPAPPQA